MGGDLTPGLSGSASGVGRQQGGGGRFDAVLQLGHELGALQACWNRRQELKDDGPRIAAEAVRRPVDDGVGGDGPAGAVQVAVQGGDAGLVVGRGAGRLARAFGEDDDLAALVAAGADEVDCRIP